MMTQDDARSHETQNEAGASIQETAAAYVTGDLSDAERAAFEQTLEADDALRAGVEADAALLMKLRAEPPYPMQRDLAPGIVKALQHRHASRRRVLRVEWASFAAAAVLLLGVILHGVFAPAPSAPASATDPAPSTDSIQAAQRMACTWLARTQRSDGSWDIEAYGGRGDHAIAIEGLALLAFLEAGDTFKHYASRTAEHLASQQQPSGRIGADGVTAMYNHGIAATALSRAAQTLASPAVRDAARRALAFLAQAQTKDGGWGYHGTPDEPSNTAVSAWQIAALHAASDRDARADAALTQALAFFEEHVHDDGQVDYDTVRHAPVHRDALAAMGAFCLLLEKDDRSAAGSALRKALDADPAAAREIDPYAGFFLVEAARNLKRKDVQDRIRAHQDALRRRQVAIGDETGSFAAETVRHGQVGGRVFATAMAAVTLGRRL